MEDALKLQGYLMKEKSKFSRLHGLTGDINKRYFRIRNIEVRCITTAVDQTTVVVSETSVDSALLGELEIISYTVRYTIRRLMRAGERRAGALLLQEQR